jgi:cation diffusion facilitator CzcD-associated flavoprotein CzcO
MATGCLSAARVPEIKGRDTFEGTWYHTGRWPHEGVDFTGQRVGVIGTGSSGIQSIPVIAEQAADVVVFQRTPNFSVPAQNQMLTPQRVREHKDTFAESRRIARESGFGAAIAGGVKSALEVNDEERRREYETRWQNGGVGVLQSYPDLLVNQQANDTIAEFVRSKIRETVSDQSVAETLSPRDHPLGTKRICVDTNYYQTYNRENVTLVNIRESPIEAITRTGIRTADGEYELDSIVFATGFDAMTGTLTKIDIVGRDGLVLRDKWDRDGLRSNLGISVHGFPNFFMSLGPQTPYSNLPVPIQLGAQWLQRLLVWARENDVPRIEATAASEQWWLDETNRAGEATVMCSEGEKAGAWFLGHNVPGKGRAFQVYMGGGQVYQDYCRQAELDGYASFVNDRVAAGTPAVVPA